MQKAQQKQRRKAFAQQKQTLAVFAKRASTQLKEPAEQRIPTYKFSTATGTRRVKMSCWSAIYMRKIIMTDDFALLTTVGDDACNVPGFLHVLVQNDVSYNSSEVKLLVEYAESMLGKKYRFDSSPSYMVHNYKRGYTFKELMY